MSYIYSITFTWLNNFLKKEINLSRFIALYYLVLLGRFVKKKCYAALGYPGAVTSLYNSYIMIYISFSVRLMYQRPIEELRALSGLLGQMYANTLGALWSTSKDIDDEQQIA